MVWKVRQAVRILGSLWLVTACPDNKFLSGLQLMEHFFIEFIFALVNRLITHGQAFHLQILS